MAIDKFNVNKNEIEMDLDIGDSGILMVPVKVTAITKDEYEFQKVSQIKAEGEFKSETVEDMRKRIGVVEDTEEPIDKKDED